MTKKTSSQNNLDTVILGAGLLLVVAAVVLLGILFLGKEETPSTPSQSISVLFIGNSYTAGNNLPKMFAALAESGGHEVTTGMLAEGGWGLPDHLNNSQTSATMNSQSWDYVFLQEQSVVPAIPDERTGTMYPAARQLVQQIRAIGSTPILFMTWGRRDGLGDVGYDSYEPMQTALTQGYMGIANELEATVAPVGMAWQAMRQQYPDMNLYKDDGSHPNTRGSYLAACVFYAVILQESPEGLQYHARLSSEETAVLQRIAAETVLSDLARWHVPVAVSP